MTQTASPTSVAIKGRVATGNKSGSTQGGSRQAAISGFPFGAFVNEIGTVDAAVTGAYLCETPPSPKTLSADANPASVLIGPQPATTAFTTVLPPVIVSRFSLGLGLGLGLQVSKAYFAPPSASTGTGTAALPP